MAELFETLAECIKNKQLVALVTVMEGKYLGGKLLVWKGGKATLGSLGNSELDLLAVISASSQIEKLGPGRVEISIEGEKVDVFVDVYPPPLRLVIIGAVHIAVPLVSLAKVMGFYTIVVDARSTFATPKRFPHADQLVVKWPSDFLENMTLDEGTCLITLTHDEKLDNPALAVAVRSRARYIGALGSPKTHAKRVVALKEMGLNEQQISRIHAPVGLDIGAKNTEEIAMSILAEIIAVLHGKIA